MKVNGIQFNVACNTKIKFSASAYVSGYKKPTLEEVKSGTGIFMEK